MTTARKQQTTKALPRKKRRGVTTDLEILDSAEKLFARYGYDAVSTKQLAAETGVTIGALYHYFPSKEAVYEAVIEQAFTRHSTLPEHFFNSGDSEQKKLSKLIAWFVGNLTASKSFGQLFQREILDSRSNNADKLITKYFHKPYNLFRELLRASLPTANQDTAFATALALCVGFANLNGIYTMAPEASKLLDSPEKIADHAVWLLLTAFR
ncbi:MAG: TetR/AcrR family transcriptional regulator [Tissierellales bacterium]